MITFKTVSLFMYDMRDHGTLEHYLKIEFFSNKQIVVLKRVELSTCEFNIFLQI